MINVIVSGRTDIEAYFQKSGIRECKKLNHTPFLVFDVQEDTVAVEVKIVDRADALLNFPDNTKVMGQWGGEWRSDFFQFTIGEFREYITKYP